MFISEKQPFLPCSGKDQIPLLSSVRFSNRLGDFSGLIILTRRVEISPVNSRELVNAPFRILEAVKPGLATKHEPPKFITSVPYMPFPKKSIMAILTEPNKEAPPFCSCWPLRLGTRD